MNFLMTLGLVMILVGCVKAGLSLPVSETYRRIPPKDDMDKDNYDESITLRKPIPVASYITSAKRDDITGSPKRSAFEHTGEDGKSNVDHHDEETYGGYARVARATDIRFGGEYNAKPSPHFGGIAYALFKKSGNDGGDDEHDDFMGTY